MTGLCPIEDLLEQGENQLHHDISHINWDADVSSGLLQICSDLSHRNLNRQSITHLSQSYT